MTLVREDEKTDSAITEEEGGDTKISIDEKVDLITEELKKINLITEDLKNLRLQLANFDEKFSESQIVPRWACGKSQHRQSSFVDNLTFSSFI